MKWAVVTLTAGAARLGKKLAKGMCAFGDGDLYVSNRFLSEYSSINNAKDANDENGRHDDIRVLSTEKPFKDFVGTLFYNYDSIIFIMATGIVCRSIAPYIQSKTKDPAIIVCDEAGRHAISLLSGHLGGGNELSKKVAMIIGAEPVITTASDVTGNMAVDMFAQSIDTIIASMEAAKDVTALAVDGKKICILIDKKRMENKLYHQKITALKYDNISVNIIDKWGGIDDKDIEYALGFADGVIAISENRLNILSGQKPYRSVQLIPKSISLGIGCRRDTADSVINSVFNEAIDSVHIDERAIRSISTIQLKADEVGIHALCRRLNLALTIVDLESIAKVHHLFNGSDFVQKTIGVRAVSEPCAMISGSENGYMRLGKYAKNGVTISLWEDL